VNSTITYNQDGVNAFLSIDLKIKENAEEIEDDIIFGSTNTFGLNAIIAWIS
jgi:hypothetical protein